jgi:segregation and condensation protein A
MIDNDSDTRTEDDVEDTALADEPRQEEMPFAVVEGVPITELPRDLYIPPNALEVFLEAFEGPLDLLLYLIKRQNLNILDIPIAEITRQYMEYVDVMKDLRLELAAEYLVMAAMLAEIKSRMLLPRPDPEAEDEGDPRAELIRRLQEYERYKQAAEDLDCLPRVGRDTFPTEVDAPFVQVVRRQPTVRVEDLLMALTDVFRRARMYSHHHVLSEPLSVRERMSAVLAAVERDKYTDFTSLFKAEEGRRGVIVTLLAVLELVREMLIELVQAKPLGPIHVRAQSS